MTNTERNQRIADVCGLSPRTVRDYFKGRTLGLASTVLIERACFELGYPMFDPTSVKPGRRKSKYTVGV
jgi:hypothetical protein